MKKLMMLLGVLLMCVSVVSAETVLLVTDDDSPASDVIILSTLGPALKAAGHQSEPMVNSEYSSDSTTTVFVYYGNALIVTDDPGSDAVEIVVDHLETEYGINAEISETASEDLRNDIECEDCPKGVMRIINEMETPFVISPLADKEAADLISIGSKIPEEVTPADILNQPLVIIGGPCANEYWTMFSEETCETWPGQKLVKKAKNGEKDVILIAGTTKEETLDIVQKISTGTYFFEESTIVFDQ